MAEAVGSLVAWNGRWLGTLYHPGAQAAIHRSWVDQTQDARILARRIKKLARNNFLD